MRHFFLILLLSFPLGCFSQPIPFDSLRMVVKDANDQHQQINALMILGSAFRPSQADSVFFYAEKINKLIVKKQDSVYAGNAEAFLKGVGYFKKSDLRKAIPYFRRCAPYFETTNPAQALKAWNFLGGAYSRMNELDSAKQIFEYILAKAQPSNKEALRSAYGNLGIVYRKSGNYLQAIEYFELCAKSDPTDGFTILNSYLNVAAMFADMEMFDKAVVTLAKVAIDTFADSPVKLAWYNNQGENFYRLKQSDSAAFYFQQGIKLAGKIKQYHQMVKPLTLLASVQRTEGRLAKAKETLDRAGSLCPKYCPPPVLIEQQTELMEWYVASKMPDSAISTGKALLLLTEKAKAHTPASRVAALMAGVYEFLGDAGSANYYYKLQQEQAKLANATGRARLLADARVRYKTSEKEELLAAEEKETAFYQKLSFRLGAGALFLLLLSLVIYYYFFKVRTELVIREDELQELNERLKALAHKTTESGTPKPEYLMLRSKALVKLDELMYVKSDGHYVELYLDNKSLPEVDRNTISGLSEQLPDACFAQVHRSYIVNVNFIRAIYARELVLKNGMSISISRSFKSAIENLLINNAA